MAEAALFCVLGDAGPADGCAQDFLELLGDLAGAAALGEPFADEVGVGVGPVLPAGRPSLTPRAAAAA